MFEEAIESLLTDHCTPAVVREAEAGGAVQPLHNALVGSGFLELLAAEEHGGAGASMIEFQPVVALCGAYALPLPLAQTLAARLLTADPASLPADAMITFAQGRARRVDGGIECARVPFAMTASHVIARLDDGLVILPLGKATIEPTGVHASLAASLRWGSDAVTLLPSTVAAGDFEALGAVLHAGLLAGAMTRVFDMTLVYGNERSQFGKSIGKFQAIQHQLALMAEQVAATSIAAQAAFMSGRRLPSPLASAIAKSRASEAAQEVAAISHAVHGAIGVTDEFDLQLYTRRLHEWRQAHGSEDHWNPVIGRALLATDDQIGDFVRSIAA